MRTITKIIVHHTATRPNVERETIVKAHRLRGFTEIGYHWLLHCPDGVWIVTEGRKESVIGAHARGHNLRSIGIAVAGNYQESELPNEARTLLIEQLARICKRHKLPADRASIRYHRELSGASTLCPGKHIIKQFEQIVNEVGALL